MTSPITTAEVGFEEHCRSSVDRLRAALIELYDEAGADSSSPQDVAREFGLNKNLTWKISKIINAEDLIEAAPHVPGTSGVQILLKGFEKAGVGGVSLGRVREAANSFEEMIEVQVGDRATLELVLDGMAVGASDRLETSRRLSFRGNSGVWGVQAKVRLASNLLIPNADDPEKLDIATVRGYVGFRRLRPAVRWPLFRIREWGDSSEPMLNRPRWEALELEGENASRLMPTFTSARLPDIKPMRTSEGVDYVLVPGPIGNFGAVDCFQGEMMRRAVSGYAEDGDPIAEFGVAVTVPAEYLVMDLIVHESLEYAFDPRVLVFGREFSQGQRTADEEHDSVLPIRDRATKLSGRPPVVTTPLVPQYAGIFQTACARLGVDARELRGYRLLMKYPPMGATVVQRFELPERG